MSLLLAALAVTGCRDRGQDVPGGGWVGTPMSERAGHQGARASLPPEARAAALSGPAAHLEPDAGLQEAPPPADFDDPSVNAQAALALLDRPVPGVDSTTDALLAEAARLAARGQVDAALAEVRRAKLRTPEAAPVLLAEGRLLFRSGAHRQAERRMAQILSKAPDDEEALYLKALAHLALDEPAAARPLLATLQARHPEHPGLRRIAARVVPESQRVQATARAAATGDPAAIREHADALMEARREDEAISYYALAAARRPDDVELHVRWGSALLAQDDLEGAIKVLTRVTELSPKRAAAWHNLATARERTGDRLGAVRAWQGLLDNVPGADPRRRIRERMERLRAGR